MDRLLDFGLPGLVFLALVVWLVRKVIRAARTERDLEGERLTGAFADELRAGKALASGRRTPQLVTPPPRLVAPPASPLDGADVQGAMPEHLRLVESLAAEREAAMFESEGDVARRLEVVWVKSTATHVVWCERRHPATRAAAAMAREVVCVARVLDGKAVERWSY
ncbi:MAG TPA: hypothetical protein VGH20_01030 [Myxococcales bacterium]|jgi:hypothetical protein